MVYQTPHIDTLIVCASVTTIGLYACAIWQRSLRTRHHQLYINAAIRILDVLWNGGGQRPPLRQSRDSRGRAE